MPKPDGPVVRAREWVVRQVYHPSVWPFFEQEHYAKGAGNTSVFTFGLFERSNPEVLRGASVWLPPLPGAAAFVGRQLDVPPDSVLMLTRLAVAPEVPTNGATFLLGRSIRGIRRDPRWCALVTYADHAQGHRGMIYHATNWTELGLTKPERLWVDDAGRQVARRCGPQSRTVAEMRELGYTQLPSSRKTRFVMRLRRYDWMLAVALEHFG